MTLLPVRRLRAIFSRLYRRYGEQHWWPGDGGFEIMVGAVLTQNTAWINVERALAHLRAEGRVDAQWIADCDPERLARLIRPSGYFNVKAKRLRNVCRWYLEQGGTSGLRGRSTADLRASLLAVNGVGPETADDILLYALERPVFVIDAYTRRIFARLGLIQGDEPYETLRLAIEAKLGPDVALYNEYHALLVRHGNEVCRPKPRCDACCLRRGCRLIGL